MEIFWGTLLRLLFVQGLMSGLSGSHVAQAKIHELCIHRRMLTAARGVQLPMPSPTMCIEKVVTGVYHGMAAHPDGSDRAFLWSQEGTIQLAEVPPRGSGAALRVDDVPFLDIRDRVHYNAEHGLGLVGMAFHPEFAINGRFFVSYTCNSTSLTCAPSAANSSCSASAAPGPYLLVVEEFTAKAQPHHSKVIHPDPSRMKTIFVMGLPQPDRSSQEEHAGELFLCEDQHLCLVTGHGRSQSKISSSYNGEILMLDVESKLANEPRVLARGINSPRGCSSKDSSIYCANINEQLCEVLSIFNKAVVPIINHGRPAAGTAPSLVGGRFYSGSADAWFIGRYVYMYASAWWAAVETPAGSGRYNSTRISDIRCSGSTPLACPSSGIATAGRVIFVAEDNRKDLYIFNADGGHRMTESGQCGAPPLTLESTLPGWIAGVVVAVLVIILAPLYFCILPPSAGGCFNGFSCSGNSFSFCGNITKNNVQGPGASSDEGRA